MNKLKFFKIMVGAIIIQMYILAPINSMEPDSSSSEETHKRGTTAFSEDNNPPPNPQRSEEGEGDKKYPRIEIERLPSPFTVSKDSEDEKTYVFNWGLKVKEPTIEMDDGRKIDLLPYVIEMIKNEELLRSKHVDLETKENFAQYVFVVINSEEEGLVSFSCLPSALQGEQGRDFIGFYANGMIASQYPGFSHQMETYPWMSQSTQDTRLILFQRPSSRIEVTRKTVQLLHTLSEYTPYPPTFHPRKLERMMEDFARFQEEQPQIESDISKLRDKLFNALDGLYQLLEENSPELLRHEKVNNIINQTINNLNVDLEGRVFEIRRDFLIHQIQEKIEQIKVTCYSSLLKDIEELKSSEQENKRQIGLLYRELNSKEEIKRLNHSKAGMIRIFEELKNAYTSLIHAKEFKNLCTCRKFNFGCSEQLLIDHLFDADKNIALAKVIRNLKQNSKVLALLIHSSMTPCKTCSLDIALEMLHQDGRIRKFFSAIDQYLEIPDLRKLVIISFHKTYDPTDEDKKYGFNFGEAPAIYAGGSSYFLIDFSTMLQR